MDYQSLLAERIKQLELEIEVSKVNKEKLNKLSVYRTELETQIQKVNTELSALGTTTALTKTYKLDKRKSESNQITSTITAMSNLVFPEYGYTYFLDGKISGDFTHTELLFRNKKGTELIPAISNGDGQQELVSLGSTVSLIALSDFTPTVILDEPLANLSPDKAPIAGEALSVFGDYGLQMFIIEHTAQLFDNIKYYNINLANIDGETVVSSQGYVDNRPKEEE